MAPAKKNRILPNYAVHFKAYLEEWMEENDIDLAELDADLKTETGGTLSDIMATKVPVNPETAELLERITDIPRTFWSSIDELYHQDAKRLGLPINE